MDHDNLAMRLIHTLLTSAFGSDEFQGYTAEYAWCENQMAHATMGFVLAMLIYWGLPWWTFGRLGRWLSRHPWVRLALPYAIVFKTLPDAALTWWYSSVFGIDWFEFYADKITDISFWYFGMLLGQTLCLIIELTIDKTARTSRRIFGLVWAAALLVGWAALLVQFNNIWIAQKKTFDRSNLPPGWVRVGQYDTNRAFAKDQEGVRKEMEKNTKEYLKCVSNPPAKARHCVVRGGWPVNRSNLAVALGTEYASRSRAIYYHTASKLVEEPKELHRWKDFTGEKEPSTDHPMFPRCVVIDDLAAVFPRPALPDSRPRRDPQHPYSAEDSVQDVFDWFLENRDRISTVWVLTCNPSEAKEWLRYIRIYVGDDDRVIDIDLGNPFAKRALFP
jgi:hypothetical protein